MKELWPEKYRPSDIDSYVFTDPTQREQISHWIQERSIPHLLLSGPAGTGKTTLAKVLVSSLGIDGFDFLHVNASRDNGVDFLKNKIEGFVSTMPFGHLKVVLLDEADYLSHNAQALLRGLMETYAAQARFILTCNLLHKIIPPLKSRCTHFLIDKTDITEFTARAARVLMAENVEFDLDTLDTYVRATYPDLRSCLKLLQVNSLTGQLAAATRTADGGSMDYRARVVDLFKKGRVREARVLLCKEAAPEDMEEIFRWMYENLDLWSTDEEKQDQAITIIRQGLVNHSIVADAEINLAATMVELAQL
jgi:replication factor C small subunit